MSRTYPVHLLCYGKINCVCENLDEYLSDLAFNISCSWYSSLQNQSTLLLTHLYHRNIFFYYKPKYPPLRFKLIPTCPSYCGYSRWVSLILCAKYYSMFECVIILSVLTYLSFILNTPDYFTLFSYVMFSRPKIFALFWKSFAFCFRKGNVMN